MYSTMTYVACCCLAFILTNYIATTLASYILLVLDFNKIECFSLYGYTLKSCIRHNQSIDYEHMVLHSSNI